MIDRPICDDDIELIFAGLGRSSAVALAVSGGADSIALMHLAARWRLLHPNKVQQFVVVTVDHGLRPEAAEEARWVARAAQSLGLHHVCLTWQGDKPVSNIQEAARCARYDLIASYCHEHGLGHILTAHHLDDQAETVLMRLARGSGVDGLAAIPVKSHWAGITLFRPLLDFPKSRLIATLESAGLSWLEDPSNSGAQYERNRVRQVMVHLERLGFNPERLALTAQRMRRAQEALDTTTNRFLNESVRLYETGHCEFGLKSFCDAPDEIALRGLARMVEAVGGQAEPPRLRKLETLLGALKRGKAGARTLAGCRVDVTNQTIRIFREKGRLGYPEFTLEPGNNGLWDRRFRVSVSPQITTAVTVRALGRSGFAALRREHASKLPWPSDIGSGLVSFWQGCELICVPHLYYSGGALGEPGWAESNNPNLCSAEFINADFLTRNSASRERV